MKFVLFTALFVFSMGAHAQNVLKKLSYNVTAATCTSPGVECENGVASVVVTFFDNGTAWIEKEGGDDSGTRFMSTNSDDGGFEVLTTSADFRRLNYSNTEELAWGPGDDANWYINERISINIEFYQINASEATLVESTTMVNNLGEIRFVTYTANLKM